ncbi:MAG: carboxypeptidase-like regulatory domain-containing protein, partial [Cyclobacteriaceae bacterium]
MIFNKHIFLLFIFLKILILPLKATDGKKTMHGKVMDANGNPLPGASVYIHELHRGTITDEDGFYRLDALNKGVYHIHVTFIGYEA